jgi:hypothetical protein
MPKIPPSKVIEAIDSMFGVNRSELHPLGLDGF